MLRFANIGFSRRNPCGHGVLIAVMVLSSMAIADQPAQDGTDAPAKEGERHMITDQRADHLQFTAMNASQLQQLLDMLTTPDGAPKLDQPRHKSETLTQLSAIATLYPPQESVPISNRQVQMRAANALAQHAAVSDRDQLREQLELMRRLSESVRRLDRPDAAAHADYWDLVADLIEINAATNDSLDNRQDQAAHRLQHFIDAYPLQPPTERDMRTLPDKLAVETRLARLRLDMQRGIDAATCELYRQLVEALPDDDKRLSAWSWMPVVCRWLDEPTTVEQIDIEALPFDRVMLQVDAAQVIQRVIVDPVESQANTKAESTNR